MTPKPALFPRAQHVHVAWAICLLCELEQPTPAMRYRWARGDLSQALAMFGTQITTAVLPALTAFAQAFGELAALLPRSQWSPLGRWEGGR